MSFRTILAILQERDDGARVLDCAVPLAIRFGAHLIGIHGAALPIAYPGPMGFPDADLLAAGSEAGKQHADELQQVFQARMGRDRISSEWRFCESLSGDSVSGVLTVARASDLVIVQQGDPERGDISVPSAETLIFETGRPILFLPYASNADPAFEKVLLAWNGSAEAARAAFDALPFIAAAKETEILCLDPKADAGQDAEVAAVDIAAALSRHGAKISITNQSSQGIAPGEAIGNRLVEGGAQLLVMGAYSQSWLKQFLFGGTTRTLLNSMPTATLMSH